MPRVKRFMANITLVLASLTLSLFIGELAVRIFLPWDDQRYAVGVTANQYAFYRYDPILGWANAARMSGEIQREEFHHPIQINRHGMRDRDVTQDLTPDQFRIAFLGDSFVWGIGVSNDQRFTDIIGNLDGIEALNFGVTGYSAIQYFLDIDRVIKFRPHMVIIAVCYNDFEDNILAQRYGYFKPYAEFDRDGELNIDGYPIPSVKQFGANDVLAYNGVMRNSSIAMNIYAAFHSRKSIVSNTTDPHITTLLEHDKAQAGASFVEAVRINTALIGKIKAALDTYGIKLVLLTAVTKFQYDPKGQYGHVRVDYGFSSALKATGNEIGVDVIDTIDVLNGFDFWEKDGHWKPSGHLKTATEVCGYLKSGAMTNLSCQTIALPSK